MATAVSAGAARTGVRGGVELCSCAITMATTVRAGAATAGVRGGMGLCSYAASVITLDTVAAAMSESWNTYMVNLKSQVVYSKQPKLGLTQEFVVDCAHALWVVRSIKRLVSLMLLKWFYLIVLFILCIGCLTKILI